MNPQAQSERNKAPMCPR